MRAGLCSTFGRRRRTTSSRSKGCTWEEEERFTAWGQGGFWEPGGCCAGLKAGPTMWMEMGLADMPGRQLSGQRSVAGVCIQTQSRGEEEVTWPSGHRELLLPAAEVMATPGQGSEWDHIPQDGEADWRK